MVIVNSAALPSQNMFAFRNMKYHRKSKSWIKVWHNCSLLRSNEYLYSSYCRKQL